MTLKSNFLQFFLEKTSWSPLESGAFYCPHSGLTPAITPFIIQLRRNGATEKMFQTQGWIQMGGNSDALFL